MIAAPARIAMRRACPTVCFILSAKDLGTYADMAAVAALAVRRLHPHSPVVLAVDEPTAHAIEGQRHGLRDIASKVVVCATGTDRPSLSSRAIKTTLRQALKGDFLFLDTDAIAVKPLNSGWPRSADLAAARDWNQRPIHPYSRPLIDDLSRRLGWSFRRDRYFNTGVLWVRDTPAAHAFYERWHRRWQQSREYGVHFDQPAFNTASTERLARIAMLPDADNWAPSGGSLLLRRGRARIFHFWAQGKELAPDTLLGHLIARYRQDGILDHQAIARASRENLAWTANLSPARLLRSGHRARAVVAYASRFTRRVLGALLPWAALLGIDDALGLVAF